MQDTFNYVLLILGAIAILAGSVTSSPTLLVGGIVGVVLTYLLLRSSRIVEELQAALVESTRKATAAETSARMSRRSEQSIATELQMVRRSVAEWQGRYHKLLMDSSHEQIKEHGHLPLPPKPVLIRMHSVTDIQSRM